MMTSCHKRSAYNRLKINRNSAQYRGRRLIAFCGIYCVHRFVRYVGQVRMNTNPKTEHTITIRVVILYRIIQFICIEAITWTRRYFWHESNRDVHDVHHHHSSLVGFCSKTRLVNIVFCSPLWMCFPTCVLRCAFSCRHCGIIRTHEKYLFTFAIRVRLLAKAAAKLRSVVCLFSSSSTALLHSLVLVLLFVASVFQTDSFDFSTWWVRLCVCCHRHHNTIDSAEGCVSLVRVSLCAW